MTSVRDFADLNERLSRSVAINAVEQAIIKVDVMIEGMQRMMDQMKTIKDKLETYETPKVET